jgi:hypothetical protein
MDLEEVGSKVWDWMNLVQDRDQRPAVMDMVMNLRFLYERREFLDPLSDN